MELLRNAFNTTAENASIVGFPFLDSRGQSFIKERMGLYILESQVLIRC